LSFDWHEFLRLAEELHSEPIESTEASARTAISRAYYATFHLTAATLESLKEWQRAHGAEDHKKLQEFLKRYRGVRRGKIGVDLERLYVLRGYADYEDEFEGVSTAAEMSLKLARSIVNALPSI
jgi:uncharacterized protein (UPF0332 family)